MEKNLNIYERDLSKVIASKVELEVQLLELVENFAKKHKISIKVEIVTETQTLKLPDGIIETCITGKEITTRIY